MKRSLRSFLFTSLLLALLLSGCAARTVEMDRAARSLAAPQMEQAPAVPAEAPAEGDIGGVSYDQAASKTDRKIIRTASLQLIVKETENTVAAIKGLVAAQGGYVASSNVWHVENVLHAQLTVRVPAEKMEAVLADIREMAVRVEREESGGQDVTEEYVDLEARLRNLEAAETELRALLTDVREKSGKAEDVMAIYRELVNVRGQIEQTQGRMQYIDRSAELATINLSLSEREPQPIGQPGWEPIQTVRAALSALVQVAKFTVKAVIWGLILGVPLVGVPVLAIWLLWRWLRHRRELKAKAKAYEEEIKQAGAE